MVHSVTFQTVEHFNDLFEVILGEFWDDIHFENKLSEGEHLCLRWKSNVVSSP